MYKLKYLPNGSIERYKAHLVAKGFTQIEGEDFHDTFYPVAKISTVRILFVAATSFNWPIHQVDINNAFLHGFLDEEIYTLPPQGYTQAKPNQVYRLKSSVYGLKQTFNSGILKFSHFSRLCLSGS